MKRETLTPVCLRITLITVMALSGSLFLKAQNSWTAPFGSDQVFIENLGQYDADATRFGTQAEFAIDHGFAWKVFLHHGGISYITRKMDKSAGRDEGDEIGEEELKGEEVSTPVHMTWLGASPSASLQGQSTTPAYYTYSYEKAGNWVNVNHANGYQRLHTAGLYPGIDLTLTAPEDGGIKYSLLLHAGANAALVKMQYAGTTLLKDASGNLRMATVQGDLIDHAPKAWYADNPAETIPVEFKLTGSLVTFSLGSYDVSRDIVIDPWTVNPAFPLFNRAFEVDVDAAGNVYAWGGGMGYNLKKYNSAGTLQWTHVSPWDTSNAWFGELLTLPAGDCFISSGSVAKLRRLTTAGGTTFTNNGPFFNNDEYWNMVLNCDRTKLVIGGTRLIGLVSPRTHIFDVNMANGNQLAGSPYRPQIGCSAGFPGGCEGRELATGADGYIYATSNDTIYKLNTTFGTVIKIAHSKTLPYNSPSYMAKNVQGFNGLDIGTTNGYYNWGSTLEKRDNSTLAVLTTVPITGGGYTSGFFGSGPTNSGMVVDNCGNVYAGSAGNVYKFDPDLVSLGSTAVSSTVYDLIIAPGNELIVGGNGFVSSVTALATCGPKVITCPVLPANITALEAVCKNGTAQVLWTSQQEHDCDYFIIEKTENEGDWQQIGKIKAQGSQSNSATYTFTDPAYQPREGSTFLYRLQAVDLSGRTEPTGIVTLTGCAEASQGLVVFPAVTSSSVSLQFDAGSRSGLRVELLDMQGKVALEQELNTAGKADLNLSGLHSGVYMVRVSDGSGWNITGKVVKE